MRIFEFITERFCDIVLIKMAIEFFINIFWKNWQIVFLGTGLAVTWEMSNRIRLTRRWNNWMISWKKTNQISFQLNYLESSRTVTSKFGIIIFKYNRLTFLSRKIGFAILAWKNGTSGRWLAGSRNVRLFLGFVIRRIVILTCKLCQSWLLCSICRWRLLLREWAISNGNILLHFFTLIEV